MTRRFVSVRRSIHLEWTSLVEVDVPAGVTADRLDEIVDAAIAAETPMPPIVDDEDISVDDWSWVGAAPATIPPPGPAATPVPDNAWVTWSRSRWATDGRMIVREDMIPHALSWCEGGGPWRTYPAADVTRLLDAAIDVRPIAHTGIFDVCFADLLAMGVTLACRPQNPSLRAHDPMIPAALFVGGLLAAVIQPRSAGPGIRADGTPVPDKVQP